MPIFASQSGRKSVPLLAVKRFGTVAQLDNASGYGPEDWGFESLRYHDFAEPPFGAALFFVYLRFPSSPFHPSYPSCDREHFVYHKNFSSLLTLSYVCRFPATEALVLALRGGVGAAFSLHPNNNRGSVFTAWLSCALSPVRALVYNFQIEVRQRWERF